MSDSSENAAEIKSLHWGFPLTFLLMAVTEVFMAFLLFAFCFSITDMALNVYQRAVYKCKSPSLTSSTTMITFTLVERGPPVF